MRHPLLTLGLAFALTSTVSCSSKTTVSGVVTLDGKPLDNGTIAFFPIQGDGQTSAAIIGTDGSYRMAASPTKMKVVIHSSKVIGRKKVYADMPDSPVDDILKEILPLRYCDEKKTELTADIAPGSNEVNFDLKSNPKKK